MRWNALKKCCTGVVLHFLLQATTLLVYCHQCGGWCSAASARVSSATSAGVELPGEGVQEHQDAAAVSSG